jgi:hypothetical protein
MKLKTFTNPSIFGDLWKPEVKAKQKSKIDYQKPYKFCFTFFKSPVKLVAKIWHPKKKGVEG